MTPHSLLSALGDYEQTWAAGLAAYRSFDRKEESQLLDRFRSFVLENQDCFQRTHYPGHVTGAALVLTPSLDRVLLTLHGKLNKWLQLGGHSDGHPHPEEVAIREAHEESGLQNLSFLKYEKIFGPGLSSPMIFDLDIHEIPARKDEPRHFHYDVRYLIVAHEPDSIQISSESQDLAWHPLDSAYHLTHERSMHRQFDKLRYVSERLKT